MKITLKLYAMLTDYLPPQHRHSNIIDLEVADHSTIANIIEPYELPEKLVHLVLVNGRYVEPHLRMSTTLVDGDVLAIWPPIAGG